jgi:hypothetical protein
MTARSAGRPALATEAMPGSVWLTDSTPGKPSGAEPHPAMCPTRSSRHPASHTPGIPHTRTGKKLEVPVKRLIRGDDPNAGADPGSVDQPSLIGWYRDIGIAHRSTRTANETTR